MAQSLVSSTHPFFPPRCGAKSAGFTLIEMLVAMAVTLLMMAGIVNLFARVSGSVQNRRATIEMSAQVRHARNLLQQDLSGTTAPTLPWLRPGQNAGYLEIIEGRFNDVLPTALFDPTAPIRLDANASTVPLTGLGDYDDVLAFTARSVGEPFVGKAPNQTNPANPALAPSFIESPVAEVIWFAVENPASGVLGEPGLRTIYRRTLLVAPWVRFWQGPPNVGFKQAGVVFEFVNTGFSHQQRIAKLIQLQEMYDLSMRLELVQGQFVILLNTLGDLTKRENRWEHHAQLPNGTVTVGTTNRMIPRSFPYEMVSGGIGYTGNQTVAFQNAPFTTLGTAARFQGIANGGVVTSYVQSNSNVGNGYQYRPYAYTAGSSANRSATPKAIMDANGSVVHVTNGPAPLYGRAGDRLGQDVVLSNVLAFDVRVYDSRAPLYVNNDTGTVVDPSDPGWPFYLPGASLSDWRLVNFGAYVDLFYHARVPAGALPPASLFSGKRAWKSGIAQGLGGDFVSGLNPWTPVYGVYDTWSFHYEDDGWDTNLWDPSVVPESQEVDDGTDGLDNPPFINGVDDLGERETAPPYDVPLRGLQVKMRVYEPDSRQIREVTILKSFVPEQ